MQIEIIQINSKSGSSYGLFNEQSPTSCAQISNGRHWNGGIIPQSGRSSD